MKTFGFRAFVVSASLTLAVVAVNAQQPRRIPGRLDNGRRVALAGHVSRKALPQNDLGRVDASFELPSVTLVLKPSATGQAALTQFLQEQQDPASPNYHRWLTPDEFGARFGANDADIQQMTDWLKSQGLTVENVARGRDWIPVSGTAGQIGKAFGAEIHRYKVDGVTHFANSGEPTVPAAMAELVAGITGLHDFRMQPRLRK